MVRPSYFCPRCGELWDMLLCDECGFTSEEFEQKPPKSRDDEVRPIKKVSHRPRVNRKEGSTDERLQ